MESGWAAEPLLELAARSINGVDNGSRDPLFAGRSDPDFEAVIAALGRLQRSRAVIIHIEHSDGKYQAVAHPGEQMTDQDRTDLAFVVDRLHLPGDRKGEFSIVFGVQTAPSQIAIGTRSMFEIFAEMAQGVEVPAQEHDRAVPPAHGAGAPLIRIRSGNTAPPDAHVSVRYHGHWFWIDGSDTDSKRTFLIAQILLSLTDTTAGANAPLVTIPTG
jgi:hypothetical protein